MIIFPLYREEYPLESPFDILMTLCTKFSFRIGPLGFKKNITMYKKQEMFEKHKCPWCKIQKSCIYAMKFLIDGSTN